MTEGDRATSATAGPTPSDTSAVTTSGPISGWLKVQGNHILLPDGKPFHGRGANIHDTRSCDSCSWEPPNVDEVLRRIDALTDDWHANFVRLLLESYPNKGPGQGRTHWRSLLEDDDYFRDLMRIIGHVGKKPGVYVLVSLWHEPSFAPLGWPSARTREVWKKLARALRDMPFVMFGLVNEPEKNADGALDAQVWESMNQTVAAIRSVENKEHRHVITVQGTREWGRVLDYYLDHPITAGGGENIAYETHVYDPAKRFEALVARPAQKLPVVIGETAPIDDDTATMKPEEVEQLWDLAEKLEIPWTAYTFHANCPPSLLVATQEGCGRGAALEPSPWGKQLRKRLQKPF